MLNKLPKDTYTLILNLLDLKTWNQLRRVSKAAKIIVDDECDRRLKAYPEKIINEYKKSQTTLMILNDFYFKKITPQNAKMPEYTVQIEPNNETQTKKETGCVIS